jgi:hypothetical protein
MVERFYSIKHLTTAQLRELYTTYRKQGRVESEYHYLKPAGVYPPELSETEILRNIDAENEGNYFVYLLDFEDEENGIIIGFSLTFHDDFSVYLYLPPELLDEMV